MSEATDVFWLNTVNIALGLFTLLCVIVVGSGVVRAVMARLARRAADSHMFHAPELGATMADGGEPIKPRGADETTPPKP